MRAHVGVRIRKESLEELGKGNAIARSNSFFRKTRTQIESRVRIQNQLARIEIYQKRKIIHLYQVLSQMRIDSEKEEMIESKNNRESFFFVRPDSFSLEGSQNS